MEGWRDGSVSGVQTIEQNVHPGTAFVTHIHTHTHVHTSCFLERKRRPLACASSVPMVLRPEMCGRITTSCSLWIFWFFSLCRWRMEGVHEKRWVSRRWMGRGEASSTHPAQNHTHTHRMIFSCSTRSASSFSSFSRCRARLRSSWMRRKALLRLRCSSERKSISLTKPHFCPCACTSLLITAGASLPSAWPGV